MLKRESKTSVEKGSGFRAGYLGSFLGKGRKEGKENLPGAPDDAESYGKTINER